MGDALYAWMTAAFRYPVLFVMLMAVTLLVNFWLAVCFLVLAALVWVIGGQVAAYFRREARLSAASDRPDKCRPAIDSLHHASLDGDQA